MIDPGGDLLDAQLRALIGPFLETLTPHQQERYLQIQDLLEQQARIESDQATDRNAALHDRYTEAFFAHYPGLARGLRATWLHVNATPVALLAECCERWPEL